MKKQLLLTSTCLLMCAATAMADGVQTVTINGQTVGLSASRLTFDGDNVTVLLADGTSQTADMEQVTIAFEWNLQPTAIGTVQSEAPAEGECYDLNGRKLTANRLAKGFYVVRQGKKVVKFVKP